MTWLDNPIAHLWGPYFLALYAMVLAIMLAPILWYRRRADQSMELGDLPIPLKIDPYQLAYLRGGLLEVLRLATVDLYQRGLIVDSLPDSSGAKRLHLLPEANLADLDRSLQAVASFYRTPRKPTELLEADLSVAFSEKTARWEQWIESERLHHSADARVHHRTLQSVMLAICFALGTCMLVSAPVIANAKTWSNNERDELAFEYMLEHPSVLLLMGGLMTFSAASLVISTTQLPQLTGRGRRFINNLQTAFARLRRTQSVASATSNVSPTDEEPDYAVPVLAMGLFGVAALQGGPLDILFEQYEKSTEAGSACGVGCGSSCGSGDGGGGCGGCGGGGCGCGG